MRILLDESLPRQLAGELSGHDVTTVQSQGWSGIKNAELLRLAAEAGLGIFITADQGIEYEQNLGNLAVGVVVLVARSNRMEHLRILVPKVLASLDSVAKGQLIRVGA